jgi:hypothetical protein
MQTNFQAGVDKIYNACVSAGTTPSAKTPDACVTAIGTIKTTQYDAGVTDGTNAAKIKILKVGTFSFSQSASNYSKTWDVYTLCNNNDIDISSLTSDNFFLDANYAYGLCYSDNDKTESAYCSLVKSFSGSTLTVTTSGMTYGGGHYAGFNVAGNVYLCA